MTLFLAVFVAASTLAVVANAAPTFLTPHKAYYSYSLTPGGYSSAITPASGTSVSVMGTQTANGFRGVGQVSMLHIPGQFLEWVGLESAPQTKITSNYSSTFGTHIVYLDWDGSVDLQVFNGQLCCAQREYLEGDGERDAYLVGRSLYARTFAPRKNRTAPVRSKSFLGHSLLDLNLRNFSPGIGRRAKFSCDFRLPR